MLPWREYTKIVVISGTTRKIYATNNSGEIESCQKMPDNSQGLSNFGGHGHIKIKHTLTFKNSDATPATAQPLWV